MKMAKKPRIQSIGVFTAIRPDHIVAIQQKICVPVGIAMMMLAAVKKLAPSWGRPVANMWWTQRPKPMNAVETSERRTARYPKRCRRENVAMMVETRPVAGMKMM